MENAEKTELFEKVPIPKAVMTLAVPTILSSLVDSHILGIMHMINFLLITYPNVPSPLSDSS